MKKPLLLLVVTGLLISNSSLLLSRHFTMPDFARGCIVGVGIGLMLFALVLHIRSLQKAA